MPTTTPYKPEVIILGAGISGLAAGQTCKAHNIPFTILERSGSVGGLTRTVHMGDIPFDYTGHFLHLSRCNSPSELPYANLSDQDWIRISRNAQCSILGHLVPSPIQYNISKLPPKVRDACIVSYRNRPQTQDHDNLLDYFRSSFGRHLTEIFLRPQNEKTLVTPTQLLCPDAMKRFLPLPNESRIEAGIDGEPPPPQYNSRFWYPRIGGIEKLVHGLLSGIEDHIKLGSPIYEINPESRTVKTRYATYKYDHLFSSIPLPVLLQLCPGPIRHIDSGLSWGSTLAVCIAAKGQLPEYLQGVHWIYYPDSDVPYYRVGIPSNIADGLVPENTFSICAEVGYAPGNYLRFEDTYRQCLHRLERLFPLFPCDIICKAVHPIDYAYVHFNKDRDRIVTRATNALSTHNIHLIGRYGIWTYNSMEDSILDTITSVKENSL